MEPPRIPVIHEITEPQPVWSPPPTDWEAVGNERAAKQAALYCANGHEKAVTIGPFFMCGSKPGVWYITECPRCHTKLAD